MFGFGSINMSAGNKITVNGVTYDNIQGNNVSIVNGTVYVDGKEIVGNLSGTVKIQFEGDVANLEVKQGSAEIRGNVMCNVNAKGSVSCGNVDGNVSAGGSVNCDNVRGSVTAGGSINCDDIGGNARAGGSICR